MSEPTRLPVYDPRTGEEPGNGNRETGNEGTLDFVALARRVEERGGRPWRSLEELADTPEFRAALEEVPSEAYLEEARGFDRRDLLKYMGVSFALAGLTGCTRQPKEKIVPYVRQPEDVIPGGKPLYFATSMTLSGHATGLLVESNLGRPTKAEGNPQHPASLGATDLFSQAAIYSLYDPDRAQAILELGEIRSWPAFLKVLRTAADDARRQGGAGLRILTQTVSSPSLAAQIRTLLAKYPEGKWIAWEPLAPENARAGAAAAFGRALDVVANLTDADVILSVGSDFLGCGPGSLPMTRQFAARRRPEAAAGMNRLYVIESFSSVTGGNADHRRPVAPDAVEPLLRAIAAAVGASGAGGPASGSSDAFAAAVAADLSAHKGRSAVLVGPEQPAAVHALGHAINEALGNFGKTLDTIEPVEERPAGQAAGLSELVRDMEAGHVTTLLILGGNPAYDAPADFRFAERLSKVPLKIHLSMHGNETSELCHWLVPESHFLEAWSDARAFDGTASIVQPLIDPLYDSRSAHELLAAFAGSAETSGYEIVRRFWRDRLPGEATWRQALHDGVIAGTASRPVRVVARPAPPGGAPVSPGQPAPGGALSIVFRQDSRLYDGRFANNGWLQEMPDPITRLSWENAALMSLATAKRLGVDKEDVVELTFKGRRLEAAAWVEPGLPDDVVVLPLGYGRRRAGRHGTGMGFDAYALRSSDALWGGRGLEIRKTRRTHPLACTQLHQAMNGREVVRATDAETQKKNPGFVHGAHEKEEIPSLYPDYPSDTYAWGMSIDLSACVGCNACVVACQAENNIPVVGKDQVRRGREMYWLRIDHYYGGGPENPRHFFQPVPCMHCEKAPCELVCPVGATVHSAEGLNDMVYNRCVGTRYCSNNCPYKVRRFNFYHYGLQFRAPSLQMMANPDVTVRWRGVMEKCTYCVQRINSAKIGAELENRRVKDGEITTACAQACPAQAIVFGDLADPESRVAKLRRDPRDYGLLAELGTRPRTSYLGAVRNPNPALKEPLETEFPTDTMLDEETGQK
jgi:molybdopterin-containing oxidoreductase family iron-sulfur binding subunit